MTSKATIRRRRRARRAPGRPAQAEQAAPTRPEPEADRGLRVVWEPCRPLQRTDESRLDRMRRTLAEIARKLG